MFLVLFLLGLAIAHAKSSLDTPHEIKQRPNVVVFIMDDVGMGDLGCFGNDTMQTPNIDALATEGAKLTQHIAFPLCTPSRAAIMTGRYPVRYGLASKHIMRVIPFLSSKGGLPSNETTYAELLQDTGYNTALIGMASRNIMRIVPFLSSKVGLPSNETTYAEMLKDHGYATALVGKWHIGIHCENNDNNSCQDPIGQGFDSFYGVPLTNLRDCRGDSNVFVAWDKHIYRDIFITYAFMLWGAYALKKRNIVGRFGFFILFTIASLTCGGFYAFIHGIKMMNCLILENREVIEQPLTYDRLADRMTQRAINFLETDHDDKPFMLTMSFLQAHTALFSSEKFTNHSKHGPYGDTIEEMDYSLGEIMSAIKRLGFDNNTFVYLTSDNGGHVEEHTHDLVREGGWNGIYKGSKGSSYEGGIRVPTIVRYPGIISPGIEISEPTHIMDILPTIASVVGIPPPQDRVIDGKDMMPLLTNKDAMSDHEFLYHYCGGYMHGVRYRPRIDSNTYKVVYSSVRLMPGPHGVEGCFNTYACQCFGSSIDNHNPPLVYDITADPSETTPLNYKDPHVRDILAKVESAIDEHKATLNHVPYQFSFLRMLPRPWAQPCCGTFPFCSCKEVSDSTPSLPVTQPTLSQDKPQPEPSQKHKVGAEEQITPQT